MSSGEDEAEVVVEGEGVGDQGEEDLQVDEGGDYDPPYGSKRLLSDVLVGFCVGILFKACSL